MRQPLGERSKDSDERINIHLEQVRIVYGAIPLAVAATLINAAILSAVLWEIVPSALNVAWLVSVCLVSLFRWLSHHYFNGSAANQAASRWRTVLTIGTIASGVTWGGASVLLFPEQSLVHQVFLAFVIAGMSAGAVTTLSAIGGLATGFLLLNLAPLVVQFALTDSTLGHVMAGMTALFALMVIVSARRLNRTIHESLLIRGERQEAQDTIQYQALYDGLSGLLNRRSLLDRLHQEMARSMRHGHLGAVLILDLDHFKTINDSLGHRIGDRLLQAVANRLKERLRDEDTVARLGGDEFAVLVPEIGDETGLAAANTQQLAFQLQALFDAPFTVEGHVLHLSASIGASLFPMNQQDPEELLQQADVAMYNAKALGRNTTQLFVPTMQAEIDQRLRIERGLRHALENGELELYYQPQVGNDGRLIGAEALVRWNQPGHGIVSPGQFIGIAEETGLIYQLGEWVLRRACEQLACLAANGTELSISVNISPKQFREAAFNARVRTILAETGAPPHLLTLEITENVVIDDIGQTVDRMQALKALGISFSVDDFGTGHSSLAYLKRLPLDEIKIDRSFVHDVDNDPNDAVIVETIIAMSHHLGLNVIAEGVETGEALAFLKAKGCRRFQGYLFGRPEPFDALLDRVQAPRAKVNA